MSEKNGNHDSFNNDLKVKSYMEENLPDQENKEKLVNFFSARSSARKQLSSMAKQHNVGNIFLWDNQDYDFEKVMKYSGRLSQSINSLDPEVRTWLQDKQFAISNSGFEMTIMNDTIMPINIYQSTQDISKVILEYYRRYKKYKIRSLARKQLSSMAKQHNVGNIFLWDNQDYDFEKVMKYSRRLSQAIGSLDPEVRTWLEDKQFAISNSGFEMTIMNDQIMLIDIYQSVQGISKGISAYYHEHKKNKIKETVGKKLSSMARQYDVGSIFLWDNQNYDFKKVMKYSGRLSQAIESLVPDVRAWLQDRQLAIDSSYKRTGLAMTTTGDQVMIVNIYQSIQDISKVISDCYDKYVVDVEMKSIESKYGLSDIFLWDNIEYEYVKIKKNIPSLKQAFTQLDTDIIEGIKSTGTRIALAKNNVSGIGVASEGQEKIISLNIGQKSGKISSDIRRFYKEIIPNSYIYGISELFLTNTLRTLDSQNDRSKQKKILEFMQDPAIAGIEKINTLWLPENLKKREKIFFSFLIARNLHFQQLPVNKNNIKEEYSNIIKKRKELENIPLFAGRNIVFGAHNEFYDTGSRKGKRRFATQATQQSIKNQIAQKKGGSFKSFRGAETNESLKMAKKGILNAIEKTKPPFTFLFNGHGGPNNIYLSDGNIQDGSISRTSSTYTISYQELANAFAVRYKNFPELLNTHVHNQDIIDLSSCYNHTFIRKFYDELTSKEVIQNYLNVLPEVVKDITGLGKPQITYPIAIGESEYNQFSYGDLSSKYGSDSYEKIRNLGNKGYMTTLGTIMKNELKGDTNFSIFIPSKDGEGFLQII